MQIQRQCPKHPKPFMLWNNDIPGPSKGCPMNYPTLPIGLHWAPLGGSWYIYHHLPPIYLGPSAVATLRVPWSGLGWMVCTTKQSTSTCPSSPRSSTWAFHPWCDAANAGRTPVRPVQRGMTPKTEEIRWIPFGSINPPASFPHDLRVGTSQNTLGAPTTSISKVVRVDFCGSKIETPNLRRWPKSHQ